MSPSPAAGDGVVLRVEHVSVRYPMRDGRTLHAVTDASFDVGRGETLGLVGESGCGKTSLGRAIMQLPPPSDGRVLLGGEDLSSLSAADLRHRRARLQMIFQNPTASLNPRRTILESVAEPLRVQGASDPVALARQTLSAVGIDASVVGGRRPHELSGGQCQRVSIARALALRPTLLICDEAVSALDVSVQAQVLNLLEELKSEFDLAMVFIAHDLAVVLNISDRVAVMYLGVICEIGASSAIYHETAHPYTRLLLDSVPTVDSAQAHRIAATEPPSPLQPPSGCRFRTRCPRATDLCAREVPSLRPVGEGHAVACHFPL